MPARLLEGGRSTIARLPAAAFRNSGHVPEGAKPAAKRPDV